MCDRRTGKRKKSSQKKRESPDDTSRYCSSKVIANFELQAELEAWGGKN